MTDKESKKYDNNPLSPKKKPSELGKKNPLKTDMLLEDSSSGVILELFERRLPDNGNGK